MVSRFISLLFAVESSASVALESSQHVYSERCEHGSETCLLQLKGKDAATPAHDCHGCGPAPPNSPNSWDHFEDVSVELAHAAHAVAAQKESMVVPWHAASLASALVRAVIVEPRWSQELETVLVNFLSVLDADIPVLWLHEDAVLVEALSTNPIVRQAATNGRLEQLQFAFKMDKERYNSMRLDVDFYHWLNAKHALFFEKDTVLCSTSRRKISDFLQFDYIGAPWPVEVSWCEDIPPELCCCNSGLSLVNVGKLVSAITNVSAVKTDWKPTQNDMFFIMYRRTLEDIGFRFPDERSTDFAVESVWSGSEAPFGLHKPWWWWGWRLQKHPSANRDFLSLRAKCPEITNLCPIAEDSVKADPEKYGALGSQFVASLCANSSRAAAADKATAEKAATDMSSASSER